MSCLFDSLHQLLQRHGIIIQNSHILRVKVVQTMLRNPNYLLPSPAPKQPVFSDGRCDKCDSLDHKSADCPWFKKTREKSTEESGVTISRWCQMVSGDMRMTPQVYVAAMGRPSTWGGALEIALMSKMFNVQIIVTRGGKVVSAFDCTRGSPDARFVIHWTGSHYTPSSYTKLR